MGVKMRNRKKAERSNLILQIELGRERRISIRGQRGQRGEGEIRRKTKCAKFGVNSIDQS
jgi:hypothetical protein